MNGSKITMTQMTQEHLRRRKPKIGAASLRCEESTLRKLSRWYDKTRRSVRTFSDVDFEEFLTSDEGLWVNTRGGRLSPVSYNTQREQLKPFIKWLIRQGIVGPELLGVLEDAAAKTVKREYERLTIHQLYRAFDAAEGPRELWIMRFAAFSFGREGELRRTRIRDFDLQTGRVNWYRPKVDDHDQLPIMGELDAAYREWLEHYAEKCGPVHPDWMVIPGRSTGNGMKWNPKSAPVKLGPIVQRCCAHGLGVPQEELKGQACHILRRTGARLLYDALVPSEPNAIRIVMAMLGHTKQETTEKYLGIRADREQRDQVMRGARLLSLPAAGNVVHLERSG